MFLKLSKVKTFLFYCSKVADFIGTQEQSLDVF